jgi:hypothetical protein
VDDGNSLVRSLGERSDIAGSNPAPGSKMKKKKPPFLTAKQITRRIVDFQTIEKKLGWVSELSKRWKVSHTEVRRFLKRMKFI